MSADQSHPSSAQKALILCVGTEVAWGETLNTNASWLAAQLLAIGIRPVLTVTVEDDPALIQSTLTGVAGRVDWVVCTGGLGPTDDDLTLQSLAQWLKTPMVPNVQVLAKIQSYFHSLNRPWVASNAKQAFVPVGAHAIDNPQGTAPGIVWDTTQHPLAQQVKGIVAMPGVPREMKGLWPELAHWLQGHGEGAPTAKPMALLGAAVHPSPTETLWFLGLGESALAEVMHASLAPWYPALEAATYVGQGRVRLRLSVADPQQQAVLAEAKSRLIEALAPYYLGDCDEMSLPEQWVARQLITTHQTVAVAESCTGGLVSSRLTDVAGSSAYVLANVVTYSNEAKIQWLGVPPDTIAHHGAVSEPVAAAMAQGVCQRMNTDWGLALTGIAGPGGGRSAKPVGTVVIGVAHQDRPGQAWVQRVQFAPHLPRDEMKDRFASQGLHSLKVALQDWALSHSDWGSGLRAQGFTFLNNEAF
jgi:nicotinamide-nucleotide amidase